MLSNVRTQLAQMIKRIVMNVERVKEEEGGGGKIPSYEMLIRMCIK